MAFIPSGKTKSSTNLTRLVWLIIFLWFALLTAQGNKFGQLGLGVLLLVGGILGLASSKQVWEKYKKDWKKLPAKKKSVWNEPKPSYYYFNILFLLPLAIVLGLCLILASYMFGF